MSESPTKRKSTNIKRVKGKAVSVFEPALLQGLPQSYFPAIHIYAIVPVVFLDQVEMNRVVVLKLYLLFKCKCNVQD